MTEKQIVIRLFLACLLGGLIGLERERNSRPAGFRTYILVSVGSALIMIVSIKIYLTFKTTQIDPGRIAAQVVSGIGFLGAGTIIREGFSVKGLTTAAGLWAVAGIGLALGAGFYLSAVVTTVLVIVTLTILNKIENNISSNVNENYLLRIKVFDQPGSLGKIGSALGKYNVHIKDASIEQCRDQINIYINLNVKKPKELEENKLVAILTQLSGVIKVEIKDLC